MNRNIILTKVGKNRYYSYKILKNNKYNKHQKRFKIRVIENLDFRNEVKFGSVVLFNNFLNKNKFVKFLNKI